MPRKVVVIGGVALGPKAACRLKRLEPDAQVILVDRGEKISYGGCGIPFYISGEVSDAAELQSTSFHMLRDQAFFRDTKDIEAHNNTEALSIDRAAKTVRVRHLPSGAEEGCLVYGLHDFTAWGLPWQGPRGRCGACSSR